jgi:hypothetical protein
MDFTRMGMQGAQPRFSDRAGRLLGGVMISAEELNLSTHPDACLIAAAPRLYEACSEAEAALACYATGNGLEIEDAKLVIEFLQTVLNEAKGARK